MMKTVCYVILFFCSFGANTFGESYTSQNLVPANSNDFEIHGTDELGIEDVTTLLERLKRASEKVHHSPHDLVMLWSICRPFNHFMALLNDTRVSLLDHLKINPSTEFPLQEHNLSLVRKAQLWLRKLRKQIKNVYKSCISPSSLKLIIERTNITDLSQLTKIYLNRQNLSKWDRHLSKSSLTRHNISIQGEFKARIKDFKVSDPIPRSTNETKKKHQVSNLISDISLKMQRKRKEIVLAKALLLMLSVNGDINMAFVLSELIKITSKSSEHKVKQSVTDRGENLKIIVGSYKREVPPYFLSVAMGARLIKRMKFAEITSSRRLLTLSRGLSPSILRFGGTSANCLLFEDNAKESDVYPSRDSAKSHETERISRKGEILWQNDEGGSNMPSLRAEFPSQKIESDSSSLRTYSPSRDGAEFPSQRIESDSPSLRTYAPSQKTKSPPRKINSSQILGLSTKTGEIFPQRTDLPAQKTGLSSSGMREDREIPKQTNFSKERYQMQEFQDHYPSASLQINNGSEPESDKNETDCVFDFPYHALYKVKPLNNTYNILAALIAASNQSSVSDGVVTDISSAADISLAISNSSDASNISESDYYLQDDPEVMLEKDLSNFTMTVKDWTLLNDFARDVGMTLLFDVNQIHRILPERSEWDPTNARKIFKAAFDRNNSVLWQLGNEPNAYRHVFDLDFSGKMDAQDFGVFYSELKQFFPQPIIVGPDITTPRQKLFEQEGKFYDFGTPPKEFLEDFLINLNVNISAITWHHYYINGRTATLDDFLSTDLLDQLIWQVSQIVNTRDELSPNLPVWLTETSSAFGGGAKNLSDRYADGFLWLDKLGVAASMGIDVVTRQTLIHDHYALIDDDLNPHSSYWLSFIHKTLVGQRVLSLKIEGDSKTTRIYAHCQKPSLVHSYVPGNIVLFGMNLASTSANVTVKDILFPHFIEQYLLEPAKGDLQSSVVLLNGAELQMTSDYELPALRPVIVPEQTFHIPPYTFGFWVFVNSGIEDCILP